MVSSLHRAHIFTDCTLCATDIMGIIKYEKNQQMAVMTIIMTWQKKTSLQLHCQLNLTYLKPQHIFQHLNNNNNDSLKNNNCFTPKTRGTSQVTCLASKQYNETELS